MNTSSTALTAIDPKLMTIEEARVLLRISKWGMYQLINDGRVATIRIGRRRFITGDDFTQLVDSLREERPYGF